MKIIYYYHIPKCGGTSISKKMQLLAEKTGGIYYNLDHHPMRSYSHWNQISNNLKYTRFIRSINKGKEKIKFVHHHHGYFGISEAYKSISRAKGKAAIKGNEFYLFTCVRDPMSFQVSRINYLRNTCHMPELSFETAISDPKHHNIMYKYFLYNHPKRWKKQNLEREYFLKNLALMDRVFLLREFDDILETLENISGAKIPPSPKKTNQGKHSLAPDDSQQKKLSQLNGLDQFFYNIASTS